MRCLLLQCILSQNRMGHENPTEKGKIMMACAEKFGAGAVRNLLRHNRRESNIRVTMTLTRKDWSRTIYYP